MRMMVIDHEDDDDDHENDVDGVDHDTFHQLSINIPLQSLSTSVR